MHRAILLLATAALAAAPLTCQDPNSPRANLHVAFVGGDKDNNRLRAFKAFLGERFGKVTHSTRAAADPGALAVADVVILDWDQQTRPDGWPGTPDAAPPCPLGPREKWHTPTVLLGSAGLNMAVVWDVRGGSG